MKKFLSFNPRTPCGVRQDSKEPKNNSVKFQSTHSLRSATISVELFLLHASVSIHALLAECDSYFVSSAIQRNGFNPRTPCGVRPAGSNFLLPARWVSIHALLAECDRVAVGHNRKARSFNPRTPCGVRLLMWFGLVPKQSFNPRTPCGVRPGRHEYWSLSRCFNPRTPCGVRPVV